MTLESGVQLPGQIARWPLDRVMPYPGNPRLHSAEEVEKLAAGMVALGFNKPIEVDEDGIILAGHRRLAAARFLGLPEVPVLQHSHLSDPEKRAFRIADNRLTLEGEWDDTLLAAEFEQIASAGLDVGLTGFAEDELAEILASVAGPAGEEELSVPDPPEVPISRPGTCGIWVITACSVGTRRSRRTSSASSRASRRRRSGPIRPTTWPTREAPARSRTTPSPTRRSRSSSVRRSGR